MGTDGTPGWARTVVYLATSILGMWMLVHETLEAEPSELTIGAALVLLGVMPFAELDRRRRGK